MNLRTEWPDIEQLGWEQTMEGQGFLKRMLRGPPVPRGPGELVKVSLGFMLQRDTSGH